MKKVIVITGPTAVGKTKVALEIAKKFKTPLINGDAFQIYKGLDILTAKPSPKELQEVKHYLMDEVDPTKEFSIYQYQKMVRAIIDQTELPIIVGGSGLYIDSVLYDYQFDNDVTEFDDAPYSDEELYQKLVELDPDNASKMHPNNRKRVARAIRLALTNGVTNRHQKNQPYYEPLIICLSLPREVLYERINNRVIQMMDDGLIDEVKNVKEIGPQASKAIGYQDSVKYLNGEITKEELIEKMSKDSRHYAKRQLTWYRNHQDTEIVDVNLENLDATISEVEAKILTFLQK